MSKTSREQIVASATELIEQEGAERFSMRRVAARLDVTPMALYHHFENRDRLLYAVLQGVSTSVDRPVLPTDPHDRARAVSLALHAFLRANPWAIPLIAHGRSEAREGLWVADTLLLCAVEAGLADEQAFLFLRTVLTVVVGEVTAFPPDTDVAVDVPLTAVADDATAFERLAARWGDYDARFSIEGLLRAVIDAQLPARD